MEPWLQSKHKRVIWRHRTVVSGGRECGSCSVNFLIFLLLSFSLSPSLPFFFFSFFPSFLLPFPFFLSPSLPSHPISLYLSLFPSISSKGSWFLISFQEHQQVYIKWLVILLGFVFIFLFSIQFWALGDNLNIFLTALYGIVQLRI